MGIDGTQLPLAFGQAEAFTFDQFIPGRNSEIIHILRSTVNNHETESIFLWGAAGTGKSHLLQALCTELSNLDQPSVYLPLSQKQKFTPNLLDDLEALRVICLDDVDQIAGDENWEQAVFHLYNRVKETGHQLIITARTAPQSIAFKLPDLASRMNWGLIYQLQDLNDNEKLNVLQQKARERSFELPDETGEYLIKRLPRDMHALCRFLNTLDVASLAAKRKLTIPFVRELLEKNS